MISSIWGVTIKIQRKDFWLLNKLWRPNPMKKDSYVPKATTKEVEVSGAVLHILTKKIGIPRYNVKR